MGRKEEGFFCNVTLVKLFECWGGHQRRETSGLDGLRRKEELGVGRREVSLERVEGV